MGGLSAATRGQSGWDGWGVTSQTERSCRTSRRCRRHGPPSEELPCGRLCGEGCCLARRIYRMEGGGTETDGQAHLCWRSTCTPACVARATRFWRGGGDSAPQVCGASVGADGGVIAMTQMHAICEALMEATPAAYGSNRFDYNDLKREIESGAPIRIDASPLLLLAGCVLSSRTDGTLRVPPRICVSLCKKDAFISNSSSL